MVEAADGRHQGQCAAARPLWPTRVRQRRLVYAHMTTLHTAAATAVEQADIFTNLVHMCHVASGMHDEAGTHYIDMIDQTTLGHQYIVKEFGPHANPTIAWQVDPFGHSATQAALLSAEVGLDALFFGRIDYQDHALRVAAKEMQFAWAPSPSLGPTASVWTEVALDGNYNPPDTFCWDYLCGGNNEQIQDRADLEDRNVDRRVREFIEAAMAMAATRKGDIRTMNVMWTMGSDFQYESAERWFINLDKIIRAVNKNGAIHARYSTPSIYYKAKLAENITWSVKTDDFLSASTHCTQSCTQSPVQQWMCVELTALCVLLNVMRSPYADGPEQQITGFYTSRPGKKGQQHRAHPKQCIALQLDQRHRAQCRFHYSETLSGYVRSSSILLQAARQLEVLTGGDGSATEPAWEAVGVLQHHDAISGTERQHVSYDYTMRLAAGNEAAYRTIDTALSKLIANNTAAAPLRFRSCPLLNISVCPPVAASKDSYTVALWNPAAHFSYSVTGVSLPLYTATAVEVVDGDGNSVDADVVPVARTAASTNESAPYAVSFMPPVQALGYQTYTIKPTTSTASCAGSTDNKKYYARRRGSSTTVCPSSPPPTFAAPTAPTVQIENTLLTLTFDNTTGLLTSWTDKATGATRAISQDFGYYIAGGSSPYSFQPAEGTGYNRASNQSVTLSVYRGKTVQMVVQRWNDWLVQVVRLWADALLPSVEMEWTVGPVEIDDGVSREVVTRYTTDIANDGNFYTDSNGREFQHRQYNKRQSYNWTVVSPIAANYYPITTGIGLNDTDTAFYVLVDRAQGGSSQLDGSLELMLHRRILYIAGFDENVNETDSAYYPNDRGTGIVRLGQGLKVTGKHHLMLGSAPTVLEQMRFLQQRLYTPLHPVFAATPAGEDTQSSAARSGVRVPSLSFLVANSLPHNVELMSLHMLFDGRVLLRLSHSFAVAESEAYSQPATVDLSDLFVQRITSVQQLTLTANADYKAVWADRRGLPYEVQGGLSDSEVERGARMRKGLVNTTVTLYPMQILTFAVSF